MINSHSICCAQTFVNHKLFQIFNCRSPPLNLILVYTDFTDDVFQRLREHLYVRRRRSWHVAYQKVLFFCQFDANVSIFVNVTKAQLSRIQMVVAGATEEFCLNVNKGDCI